MKEEVAEPSISNLSTKSYVPVLVTVLAGASPAPPPVKSSRPDKVASPLKRTARSPEIVPEKFAASSVKVAAEPLLVTVPAPRRFRMVVSKPAASMLAPASTVVCGEESNRKSKLVSAPLSVPACTWMLGKGELISLMPLVCQRTVPSSPTEPKFSVVFALMEKLAAFSFKVVPCAAAMVELPEKESMLVRVSFAVASSSPPLKATVPTPNAPPLPKASVPPFIATLPIVFASLSDTKPELTVSAPKISSAPEFSWSVA